MNNLVVENARIGFRNFSGKEGRFNAEGNRNFCVFIDDPKTAEQIAADGWNVKFMQPRNEDDELQAYLQVSVKFDPIPPKIIIVTRKGKTVLDVSTVGSLDWAEIENVDLVIRPYEWEVNGKSGVKAYAKTMYVTIAEDEFADKYDGVGMTPEEFAFEAASNDTPF